MTEHRSTDFEGSHGCRTRICLLLGLAIFGVPTQAIVYRDGVEDARFREFGAGFPSVGEVGADGACTLIAPTWVATAAHVAAGPKGQPKTVTFSGVVYAVKRIVTHPEASGPPGAPPEVDLALMELASPVVGVTPTSLYGEHDELGKPVAIVGFGDFGPAGRAARSDHQRRAATNVVGDAGPRRLFITFDAPPGGTELEGVSAAGDSGGPVLILSSGQWRLGGVSSASHGPRDQYGLIDVFTRVSSYVEWITRTIRSVP